jgi:hypothetical protein
MRFAFNLTHSAHGEERLSLSKARLEPSRSFETGVTALWALPSARQAQPLLRMSGLGLMQNALMQEQRLVWQAPYSAGWISGFAVPERPPAKPLAHAKNLGTGALWCIHAA